MQVPLKILKARRVALPSLVQACQGDWTIMDRCPKELERIYWKDKDFVIAALSQSIDALSPGFLGETGRWYKSFL